MSRTAIDDANAGRIDPPQRNENVSQASTSAPYQSKRDPNEKSWGQAISPLAGALGKQIEKSEEARKAKIANDAVMQYSTGVAKEDINGAELRTGMMHSLFGQTVQRRAVQQQEVINLRNKKDIEAYATIDAYKSMSPEEFKGHRSELLEEELKQFKGDPESQEVYTQAFLKGSGKLAETHFKVFQTNNQLEAKTAVNGTVQNQLSMAAIDADNGNLDPQPFTASYLEVGKLANDMHYNSKTVHGASAATTLELKQNGILDQLISGNKAGWWALSQTAEGQAFLQGIEPTRLKNAVTQYDSQINQQADEYVTQQLFMAEEIELMDIPDEQRVDMIDELYFNGLAGLDNIMDLRSGSPLSDKSKADDELRHIKMRRLAKQMSKTGAKKLNEALENEQSIEWYARWHGIAHHKGDGDASQVNAKWEDSEGNMHPYDQKNAEYAQEYFMKQRAAEYTDGDVPPTKQEVTQLLLSNPQFNKEMRRVNSHTYPSKLVKNTVKAGMYAWRNNEDPNQPMSNEHLAQLESAYALAKDTPTMASEVKELELLRWASHGNKSAKYMEAMLDKANEKKGSVQGLPPGSSHTDFTRNMLQSPTFKHLSNLDKIGVKEDYDMFLSITGDAKEAKAMVNNMLSTRDRMILGKRVRNGQALPMVNIKDTNGKVSTFSHDEAFRMLDNTGNTGKLLDTRNVNTRNKDGTPKKFSDIANLQIEVDPMTDNMVITSTDFSDPLILQPDFWDQYAAPLLRQGVSARALERAKTEAKLNARFSKVLRDINKLYPGAGTI